MKKSFMIFTLLFLLTACNQTDQPKENIATPIPQEINTKNNQMEDRSIQDEEKAKYLSNLATSIPNVQNATSVVLGDYTIIGIDVDENLDRSKVGSIKYSVAESIRKDPLGSGAIVIADPDLNARLVEIRDDMRAGKPIQGIMNELADITGRLMPETPQPHIDENPEEAPEEQKDEMNKHDEKQLDEQQDEQSTDTD